MILKYLIEIYLGWLSNLVDEWFCSDTSYTTYEFSCTQTLCIKMSVFTGYDVWWSRVFLQKKTNMFCSVRLLATTSADGTAKIWRTSDFFCQYELKHDRLLNWVWDCAFTSDSLFLVTGLSWMFVLDFFENFYFSLFGWKSSSLVNRDWRYYKRIYWSSKTRDMSSFWWSSFSMIS